MPYAITLDDIVSIGLPDGSANPVLRLNLKGGRIAWAKAAPGGERIAFAGRVMSEVGFEKQGVQVLTNTEAIRFVEGLKKKSVRFGTHRDTALRTKFQEMDTRLRSGEDLIITEHVGGLGTMQSHLDKIRGGVSVEETAIAAFMLEQFKSPQARLDWARMIAADLLLGNFDRLGYDSSDGRARTQVHTGNMVLAASGFLPIDNDTVLPSPKHLAHDHSKPTREALYRVVILGGELLGEGTQMGYGDVDSNAKKYLPSSSQSTMVDLLGHQGVDSIARLLIDKTAALRNGITGSTSPLLTSQYWEFRKVAEVIAPQVREIARKLVDEVKQGRPDDVSASLQATIKACKDVEAMDYSTFKVKCRFMQFITSTDQLSAEASRQAVEDTFAYGRYREWKICLAELVRRAQSPTARYEVPKAQVVALSVMQKLGRGVSHLAAGETEKKVMALAKFAKTQARSATDRQQRAKHYEDLRNIYAQLHTQSMADNRLRKATTLVIAALVKIELDEFFELLGEVNGKEHNSVVAGCFKKAISKHKPKLTILYDSYREILMKLQLQVFHGKIRQTTRGADDDPLELIHVLGKLKLELGRYVSAS